MLKPILYRRNPAQIVGHVLLANRSHGNVLAVAVLDRRSKNGGAQEDALAVMPQRAVAEIGEVRLALVKPVMDCEVVLRFAAEQLR